jgi:hypothetical protein
MILSSTGPQSYTVFDFVKSLFATEQRAGARLLNTAEKADVGNGERIAETQREKPQNRRGAATECGHG